MNQKNTTRRLGTEPILPLLFKLSVPPIIASYIQGLYNIVDSIFVSKISISALSAVSFALPIQVLLIAVAMGTGVGTASYISISLGKGDNELADNAAEHSLLLAILYGMILFLIGLYFTENIVSLMISNEELILLSSSYLRIILMGELSMFIPIIAQSILRGEGNTFIPMVSFIVGAVLNIILDPIFIFGFGPIKAYGIEGAAIATVISRFISGIFILYILFRGDNQIKIKLSEFKFNFEIIKKIYRVGFPSIIMQQMTSIMLGGLNIIVAKYNTSAVAVFGIYFRFETILLMPVYGLSYGYVPLLGYNYGAGNFERMKKIIRLALIAGGLFTIFAFMIFQMFPEQIISIFDHSGELSEIGAKALRRVTLMYPLVGLNIIAISTFQATGKGIDSFVTSFVNQILFVLPLAYLFGRMLGCDYVWYSLPISDLISCIIIFIWFKRALSKISLEMLNK